MSSRLLMLSVGVYRSIKIKEMCLLCTKLKYVLKSPFRNHYCPRLSIDLVFKLQRLSSFVNINHSNRVDERNQRRNNRRTHTREIVNRLRRKPTLRHVRRKLLESVSGRINRFWKKEQYSLSERSRWIIIGRDQW